VRRFLALGALLTLTTALGGCAKTHAQTTPEMAGLEVPAPPARVVTPPAPDPLPEELTPPDADARVDRPRNGRPQPKTESRKEAPAQKTEPPPQEPPKPVPQIPPAPPTGTLQPQLPAAISDVDRQVNEQLTKAKSTLDRVDYQRLSVEGKAQYDSVKRFIEQARQALAEKNVVFASKLAEKAVSLADGLIGR
jgi:outer membrane biosynthesis protein TonB